MIRAMRIRPFQDGDTFRTFQKIVEQTVRKIEALENEYVLKASPVELEQYYVSKVMITPPTLSANEYYINKQEGTQIDVSHDFMRAGFGDERIIVKGTVLDIAIPFTGDPELWRLRPSTYSLSGYPELEIRDGEVIFSCRFPDDSPEPERLKAEIERMVKSLNETLANLARDVENHNRNAPQEVRDALNRKLTKAKAAVSAVASLGIPIRQKAVPETFVIPLKRRESPVSRPSVPKGRFTPEPIIEQEVYEHILGVLKSMTLVIERNPNTFASLDEEAIRMHYLMQLNGHYEGSATGETFNALGKTDILVRVENRNVFIAECKFWNGPKSFSEAIDQLLSYLSWRDSKCALLIFNKKKNSSAVRKKMHEIMTARSEHRNTLTHDHNGDCRYIFVKPSDPGREIRITTMLFDMPQEGSGERSPS